MNALFLCALALPAVLGADPTTTLPLYGPFYKYFMYYTIVEVGDPAIQFTVTADTGSSDFLIPGIACSTCAGDQSTFYDSSKSLHSKKVPCDDPKYKCTACVNQTCAFNMTYAGGLYESAQLMSDRVTVGIKIPGGSGKEFSVTSQFGDVYEIGGIPSRRRSMGRRMGDMFYPEGMWGLAYRTIDSSNAVPLFEAMVGSGQVEDVFSMCLTRDGGMLGLGGILPYSTGSYVWAEMYVGFPFFCLGKYWEKCSSKETFYTVNMLDFTVQGKSIGIPSPVYNKVAAIVDNGTPYPNIPSLAFAALRSLMEANCSASQLPGVCPGHIRAKNDTLFDGSCYALTDAQKKAFPTFGFVLRGAEGSGKVIVDYTPDFYLQQQWNCQDGEIGLGISPDPDFTVIGAEMMQAYNVVFDRKHRKVGFGHVDKCPSPQPPKM